MAKYNCVFCDFVYDEAAGYPDDGIAPGTKWEDVPEDWTCPYVASAKGIRARRIVKGRRATGC